MSGSKKTTSNKFIPVSASPGAAGSGATSSTASGVGTSWLETTVNEHVAQIADLKDRVKELGGQVENLEGKQSDTQEKWLGNQELRRVVNKLETQYPELNARVVKLEEDVQAISAVLKQMVATQATQAAQLELMQQDFEASRRGACTHGAHHHSACSCATDTHTHTHECVLRRGCPCESFCDRMPTRMRKGARRPTMRQ